MEGCRVVYLPSIQREMRSPKYYSGRNDECRELFGVKAFGVMARWS